MLYNFTFPSIEPAETTVYSGVFSQKFLIKHFFEGIFAIYIHFFEDNHLLLQCTDRIYNRHLMNPFCRPPHSHHS